MLSKEIADALKSVSPPLGGILLAANEVDEGERN
jgi:hypothetical protein